MIAKDIMAQGQNYDYNPQGKVDPFEPLVVKDLQSSGNDGTETTDLSELVLVGTTIGVDSSALIKLPSDEIIHVRVGDRVGKNRAMITSIGEGKIVVRESLPNNGTQSTKKFKDITFKILTAEDKVKKKEGGDNDTVPTLDVQTNLPLTLPEQQIIVAPESGGKIIDNNNYLGVPE